MPVDSKEECVQAAGMQDVLCMSWKQDNAGPPDANEVTPTLTSSSWLAT